MAGAIDHTQSEVAKTFHIREFGNGSANGGTGASYADASMLSGTADDISYVMDDGLTSLSGHDVEYLSTQNTFIPNTSGKYWYLTFIGTGITVKSNYWVGSSGGIDAIAQNLPYGTHILKMEREDSSGATGSPNITIDGVAINDVDIGSYANALEVTFHQPKKPPIPEDACVLADYMLMADFVPISAQAVGNISKGVREQNTSRDVFYDGSGYQTIGMTSVSANHNGFYQAGHTGTPSSATSNPIRIPSFGTNIVHRGHQSPTKAQIYIDSTSQTTTDDSTNNNYGSYQYIATNKDLGVYNWGINATTVQYAGNTTSFEIATPIHTSHITNPSNPNFYMS